MFGSLQIWPCQSPGKVNPQIKLGGKISPNSPNLQVASPLASYSEFPNNCRGCEKFTGGYESGFILPGSLQITAFAVVLSLAGGFYAGWQVKAAFVDQAALRAAQQARSTERAGVQTAYQADIRYIDRLHEAKGRSDARAAALQKALAGNSTDLAACRVGADLLRVLNAGAGVPAPAGPAAQPVPAAAPVAAGPGSTCAAVIESYQRNRDEVAAPNFLQIEEIQRFYSDLQRRFNAR